MDQHIDGDGPITLNGVISDLLMKAEKLLGTTQTATLRKGLRVTIKVNEDRTYLQISRKDIAPSNVEWRIVLNSFPYPVRVTPRSFEKDKRKYLAGDWPRQGRLL